MIAIIDYDIGNITASSCVNIPRFDYQRITEWARAPCLKQNQEIENHIKEVNTIQTASNNNIRCQK